MSIYGLKGKTRQHPLRVTFDVISDTLSNRFLANFPSYTSGLVEESSGHYITLPEFPQHAAGIYNFKPRPDDVYVLSFPKSGTTWMQELVWMVVNQCDFKKGKSSLSARSPFLEVTCLLPASLVDQYGRETVARKIKLPLVDKLIKLLDNWKILDLFRPIARNVARLIFGQMMRNLDELDRMESPRIIKSHLPFYLLNPKLLETSKVVYVARNPKDVIVSYFHYHRLMHFHTFTGDLETFAEYFMANQVYSAPFFPHLLDAWQSRHHRNLHFVFYEDLKRDLKGEIAKVARFLGKTLTNEQLTQLTNHLHIDQFAKNKAVNYEMCKEFTFMNSSGKFIRKGKTGDWKNHFSPELNRRIDQWIQSNLAGSDLRFISELSHQD